MGLRIWVLLSSRCSYRYEKRTEREPRSESLSSTPNHLIMESIVSYDVLKLPIGIMMLFSHLQVDHGAECDVSKCRVSVISPRCNYRSVAPCRINDMPREIEHYNDGFAKVLLFSVTSDDEAELDGFSMFDFQTKIEKCRFSFCVGDQEPAVKKLMLLIRKICGKDPNEEQLISKPLSLHLQYLSERFNNLFAKEDYDHLLEALMHVCEEEKKSMCFVNCIASSNVIIKTILIFQALTEVRLSYIEGNHRQVMYLGSLSGMEIGATPDEKEFFFSRKIFNDNVPGVLSSCKIVYDIYHVIKKENPAQILNTTVQLSLKCSKNLASAIDCNQELCHR